MKNLLLVLSMLIASSILAHLFAANAAAQPGRQDTRTLPNKVPKVKTPPKPKKKIDVGILKPGVIIDRPEIQTFSTSTKTLLRGYDRDDFTGASMTFHLGTYDSRALGEFDNKLSSLAAVNDEGFSVRMCENDGNQPGGNGEFGYCREFGFIPIPVSDVGRQKLHLNLDNKVSYLKLTAIEPSLIVYDSINQKGKRKRYWVSSTAGNTGSVVFFAGDEFENIISSVKVGSGYTAALCVNIEDRPPSPACETFGAGRHNVRFNNAHSRIYITKL